MSVAAIVPSAGASRRFGPGRNKLFAPLAGRPLLAHTLLALQQAGPVRWIIIPAQAGEHRRIQAILRRYCITKALPLVVGGASRAESVARAVAALPPAAQWVLIHDGARPCVTPRVIRSAVAASRRWGAVACGQPAWLTVKEASKDGRVRRTLDRNRLWFAQTPQIVRRDWLTRALARTGRQVGQFPDDVSILEAAGLPVHLVPGDPLNLKVTTREDLLLAEAILQKRARRSGLGTRRSDPPETMIRMLTSGL